MTMTGATVRLRGQSRPKDCDLYMVGVWIVMYYIDVILKNENEHRRNGPATWVAFLL